MGTLIEGLGPDLAAFFAGSPLQGKPFVSGLVEVISQGVAHNRLDDAETVLTCVRLLRPRLVELDTFEAWIAMKRGYWTDAIRLLRNLDASATNWSLGKALLALCQFATRDPTWRATADDVMEGDSPEAIGLVKLLIDPEGAVAEPSPEPEPPASPPPPEEPPSLPPGSVRA